MAHRLGPDNQELRKLLQRGRTYQEIAEMYGVKRGTIASLVHRANLSEPRLRYKVSRFWSPIKDQHSARHELNMLRARERQLRGEVLSPRVEKRLTAFLARLNELNGVIAYAPDTKNGFFVVDQREIPADLIDDTLPIVKERMTLDNIEAIMVAGDSFATTRDSDEGSV